jgi:hypothetical protein
VLQKAVLTVNKMAECAVREGILREFIFDDFQDEEDSPSTPTEPNYYYIFTCILIKLVEILQVHIHIRYDINKSKLSRLI